MRRLVDFCVHQRVIVLALLLCLATAVCYAELAKLYPGTGSSYYFAEQSFLNHDKAWRYARLSMFIVGWASHLYYWIYPGVMVAVMGMGVLGAPPLAGVETPVSFVRFSSRALIATTNVLPDIDIAASSGLSTNGNKTPAAIGNASAL